MSTPVAQPQTDEDRVTAAILLVLLSNLSLPDTEAHILPLLGSLGIDQQAASEAVQLVVPQIAAESRVPLIPIAPKIERHPAAVTPEGEVSPPALRLIPGEARTPAQTYMRTTEVPRHSRYLVASAKRFQAAQSQQEGQAVMLREKRYLAQHLHAVQNARYAAKRVDNAVQRYGTTELGWYAHIDSKTTSECRHASGANFDAARPPLIGYPGAVHPFCRCHAGPAHKTILSVDQATAALRQNAVIPFATELSDA